MVKKPAKDASAARPGVEGVALVAWKAELTQLGKDVANSRILATFKYYDDAAPSVKLHEKQFSFTAATSNGDMQREVQDEGKTARATQARADQLAAQFQIGHTIDIPA